MLNVWSPLCEAVVRSLNHEGSNIVNDLICPGSVWFLVALINAMLMEEVVYFILQPTVQHIKEIKAGDRN